MGKRKRAEISAGGNAEREVTDEERKRRRRDDEISREIERHNVSSDLSHSYLFQPLMIVHPYRNRLEERPSWTYIRQKTRPLPQAHRKTSKQTRKPSGTETVIWVLPDDSWMRTRGINLSRMRGIWGVGLVRVVRLAGSCEGCIDLVYVATVSLHYHPSHSLGFCLELLVYTSMRASPDKTYHSHIHPTPCIDNARSSSAGSSRLWLSYIECIWGFASDCDECLIEVILSP